MNFTKRIVCLANSRKHSGRCIAGKEVGAEGTREWIRPISARQSAEISEEERRYRDGTSPQVLDVIEIPMISGAPHLYQTENYVIDAEDYWSKIGVISWNDLEDLLDNPETLWANGDSTYHGSNDRMKLDVAARHSHSLLLIEPSGLNVRVLAEGAAFGDLRRRVRARFHFKGVHYGLIVTDPVAERAFLAKNDGTYLIERAYLCVSLGEAHTDGSCYKLVATIITPTPLC